MKKNKYKYLKVLQQFVEGQWADVTFYDQNEPKEMKELRDDIKTYRENEPYPVRVINRRYPIDEIVHA